MVESAVHARTPVSAHDFLRLDAQLDDEERLIRDNVRSYVAKEIHTLIPGAAITGEEAFR